MDKLILRGEFDYFEVIGEVIRNGDNDDRVQFIKDFDMMVADWDFTLELYKYFKEQHELFLKEEKDFADPDENE